MDNHEKKLLELITFAKPLNQLKSITQQLDWDSDHDVVIITLAEFKNILKRFIANSITVEEITQWAELIESREDIGYEANTRLDIQEIIIEIANPLLNGVFSREQASQHLEN